jgi:hypothetical protein
MITIRLGMVLAFALLLVSPPTVLEASDDEVATRTVWIADRLLVLAPPPPGTTETVDMPQSGVLSMLQGEAVLELRGEDLEITFANGGSVRIARWLSRISRLQLPSRATLSTAAIDGLLRSNAGRVDMATLEDNAVSPAPPHDRGAGELGSTRGALGDGADWLVARRILGPADEEPPGFRGYSYLLFADNMAEGPDFERRLAAIIAYVRQFKAAEAEPRKTALFIALVDRSWETGDRDLHSSEAVVEALMRAYDFSRARVLLRRLQLPTRGPYVISGSQPLLREHQIRLDELMIMDLSWIEPHLVDLWLTEFRRIAEGEYAWESGSLRPFALMVLTGLETIGRAFSLTREAVASVIKLPK